MGVSGPDRLNRFFLIEISIKNIDKLLSEIVTFNTVIPQGLSIAIYMVLLKLIEVGWCVIVLLHWIIIVLDSDPSPVKR